MMGETLRRLHLSFHEGLYINIVPTMNIFHFHVQRLCFTILSNNCIPSSQGSQIAEHCKVCTNYKASCVAPMILFKIYMKRPKVSKM